MHTSPNIQPVNIVTFAQERKSAPAQAASLSRGLPPASVVWGRCCPVHLTGCGWCEDSSEKDSDDLGPTSPCSGLTRSEGRKFTRILSPCAEFILKVTRLNKAMYVPSLSPKGSANRFLRQFFIKTFISLPRLPTSLPLGPH